MKKRTNFRIKDELIEGAKELAREEGRSLNNWLERLIEKAIKQAKTEKNAP